MRIEYDPAKRGTTLRDRGLDMADAGCVFEGDTVTVGFLANRMVFVAWTPRGGSRRIISMRKANARERELYAPRFRR